jgi:hypothetical protein
MEFLYPALRWAGALLLPVVSGAELWPSASAIKAACSAAWRLARPVAGEAEAGRPA